MTDLRNSLTRLESPSGLRQLHPRLRCSGHGRAVLCGVGRLSERSDARYPLLVGDSGARMAAMDVLSQSGACLA